MNIEWVIKYLLPGDYVVLGVFVVVQWFLYKQFGRKILKNIEEKMSKTDCISLRVSCQDMLREKREHLADNMKGEIEQVTEKLDLILKNQKENLERLEDRLDSFLRLNGKH